MPINATGSCFIRAAFTVAWCDAVLRLVTGVRIDVIQALLAFEGEGSVGVSITAVNSNTGSTNPDATAIARH